MENYTTDVVGVIGSDSLRILIFLLSKMTKNSFYFLCCIDGVQDKLHLWLVMGT